MGRLPHFLSYGAPAWSSANNDNNNNIALKEIEKKRRYKDLELEIQRMRQMKPDVITVVVGALGTLSNDPGKVDSNFFFYAATVLSPHRNALIFTQRMHKPT